MTFTIKPPPGTPGKAWPAIVVGLFVAFGEYLFSSSSPVQHVVGWKLGADMTRRWCFVWVRHTLILPILPKQTLLPSSTTC